LNKLVSSLGLGYNWLLWLVSILTLVPITRIALRDSSNPHLSLFVYYSMYAYLNSFNGMRQFLAISIVLWAFSTLNRGKIVKFIAIVLLAMTIHVSAAVAFLAIAIRKIKLNDAVVWLCVAGSWLAGLVIVNDSMLAPFVGKYANYLDQIRDNTATAATLAALVSGLFIFIYSSSPKEFKNNYWLKLFFAAIILSNVTIQLVQGARIIIYFTVAQIILYPLHIASKKSEKDFTTLVIIVYLFAIFMKILVLGNAADAATMEMRGVYPYRPFWIDH